MLYGFRVDALVTLSFFVAFVLATPPGFPRVRAWLGHSVGVREERMKVREERMRAPSNLGVGPARGPGGEGKRPSGKGDMTQTLRHTDTDRHRLRHRHRHKEACTHTHGRRQDWKHV